MLPDPTQLRVRASVVCRRGDQLLTVLAIDPVTGTRYLFLPGGAVEPGETPAVAAVRETLEETGYAVAVVGEPVVADYTFDWGGRPYACRTSFFRATLVDPAAEPAEVHDDDYLHGVRWVDAADVGATFAYHPAIGAAVARLLATG